MAEISYPPKSVQELAENGHEMPKSYIITENRNEYEPVDLSVPENTEVPVIDISKLVSNSSSAMNEELLKLREALTTWGCFQAINHGIENSFLDEVRHLSREFFHLPMTEKQKYARVGDDYEGYGNDLVLFEDQAVDWNDRLYIIVKPEEQRKLQYWPQNPPTFRNVLLEYTAKVEKIRNQLLRSLAISLSLPENSFLDNFGEKGVTYVRFNYYPPCQKPDQVIGIKPHTDGCGLTILLQDEQVQGLQLLKDDHWFSVPIIPHALVVNMGDQLEIMSNGIFKSPVHRAVINSQKERNTLAVFGTPDPEIEFGPLEQLVDDETRPRLFKKVKNYIGSYFYYYQQGKMPIDAARV